ncbi:MAG: hypothetical protein ACYCU0_11070 [Solirubrobacteraceae bacterium]
MAPTVTRTILEHEFDELDDEDFEEDDELPGTDEEELDLDELEEEEDVEEP